MSFIALLALSRTSRLSPGEVVTANTIYASPRSFSVSGCRLEITCVTVWKPIRREIDGTMIEMRGGTATAEKKADHEPDASPPCRKWVDHRPSKSAICNLKGVVVPRLLYFRIYFWFWIVNRFVSQCLFCYLHCSCWLAPQCRVLRSIQSTYWIEVQWCHS